MIKYEIVGIPRPQGSKKSLGNGIMIESSKYVKDWRAFARLKADQAMQEHEFICKPNPVFVEVCFFFDRPQKHFLKSGLRKESPVFHTIVPDVDKLLRALLDSMKGVIFKDDSQVARVSAMKLYGDLARTEVFVGIEE